MIAHKTLARIAFCFGLALCAFESQPALASGRPFGLGVVLGEPTGLTAKIYQGPRQAVDIGLAFSFNSFVLVYADYLYHFPGVFGRQSSFVSQLAPYLGVGGVFFVSTSNGRTDKKFFTDDGSSVGLGIRIPFGIEWKPSNPPLGVFAELAPGIGIIPGTFGFLQGGIGIRYYF